MTAYYNENDPQKAAWLRELIARNLVAPGDVDERSILDVRPDDLRTYTQCHFFAGIGTWSYALRLAGWPDDREVWTGSCPCQPFSAAGQRKAFHDDRHLWPAWFLLIEARRPLVCFGEQVASYDGLAWLDLVHSDLDGAGYTCGAVDLCAAGLGAPHRRQRLYWVGHAERRPEHQQQRSPHGGNGSRRGSVAGILGDSRYAGLEERRCERGYARQERTTTERAGDAEWLENSLRAERRADQWEQNRHRQAPGRDQSADQPGERGETERLGYTDKSGHQTQQFESIRTEPGSEQPAPRGPANELEHADAADGSREHGKRDESPRPSSHLTDRGPVNGFWAGANWVLTRPQRLDDHPGLRPVEPFSFPLAHGTAARVGRLRGYGDSIVAPVAQAFIKAYMMVSTNE